MRGIPPLNNGQTYIFQPRIAKHWLSIRKVTDMHVFFQFAWSVDLIRVIWESEKRVWLQGAQNTKIS